MSAFELPEYISAYEAHMYYGAMAAEIRRLERENATLREMTEWRPIETAPHGAPVLLFCPERGISNHARIELDVASGGERIGSYSTIYNHAWATNWMPLPAMPAESLEGETPDLIGSSNE